LLTPISNCLSEQLQTFKKPTRVHQGDPISAEKLGKGSADYDPRPQEFRNHPGFQDHVYNSTINFCALSGLDISLRYAFARANMVEAEIDHAYLKAPLRQY